jgi:phosphoesterase RecJ-like protein
MAAHINPDGDTLGSMLALGLALTALGKDVTLLSADGVPPIYSFLPGAVRIVARTERRDFDLAIGLDAGDLARVGVSADALQAAARLIDIDHHVTAGQFGDVRLLDSAASATAEIIYDLLVALDAPMTADIATNLLTGVITDTGSFRYRSVTPRTLLIAADLVQAGAVPDVIAERVFDNKPFAAQKILGRALENMRRTEDGRVVWTYVSQADFAVTGATDVLTEGIVSDIRGVRGADMALFLRETPSGRFRVSLRSREPFDVSRIAAAFGGGGHRLAAGCTIDGPLASAEVRLVDAAVRHMDEADLPPAEGVAPPLAAA